MNDRPPAEASDEGFLREALREAEAAAREGEVPIGAVVVREDRVIARGRNRRETDRDPTAHAEILALRGAAKALGSWRLTGCTLYVTLEPCFMCAGAVVNARVDRLVFGTADLKAGAVGSLFDVCRDPRVNHHPAVMAGVLARESSALLRDFFASRR